MSEDDLKAVLAKYQQKSFDLYNQNIVLETQVQRMSETISSLNDEIEKLKKTKRSTKNEEQF